MWVYLVIFFATLLFFHLGKEYRRWKKLPPGPYGLPIFGYLPFIDAKQPYETFSQLAKKYGKVYSVKMGQVTCIVLADYHVIKEHFAKRDFTGRAPLFLTHGIMKGYGLICSQGELWKTTRKWTAEFFRKFGMNRFQKDTPAKRLMEEKLLKCVKSFLSDLQPMNNDLEEGMSHSIGNMLNEIIFGITYEKTDLIWNQMRASRVRGARALAVSGVLNFLPWLRFVWPPYLYMLHWINAGKDKTIEEYKRVLAEANIHDENVSSVFLRTREEVSEPEKSLYFSDKQLHQLQADIFGAGIDTSSTTIKWCLFFLCHHPQYQDKIFREIKENSTGNGEMIGLSMMPNLHFTQAFMNEVQRIRPVVPLGVPHGTLCDTNIGSWSIPAGTMVLALHWFMNRDPELWVNPEEFNPGRFLDDKGLFRPVEHFIPFQVGRRRCVGEDFGKAMVFLFITNVINEFKVSLSEDLPLDHVPDHGFSLSPQNFLINLERREVE